MDVEAVADELYGLVPGEFTAARNARAADARRVGDRPAAEAITRLRRPTTGAWLANLVVRRHRDRVGELLEVGEAMRRAHAELAGVELRRLADRRHQLIADLGAEARELAAEVDQPVSEKHLAELEATLEAASAEPAAADALQRGRLTAPLRYSGLGPVELLSPSHTGPPSSRRRQAPAPSERGPRPRRQQAAGDKPPRSHGTDRRGAEGELRTKQARLEEARRELDRSRAAIAEHEAELEDLRTREAAARRRLEEAKQARVAAERRQRAAAADLERAREARAYNGLTPKTPPHDPQ